LDKCKGTPSKIATTAAKEKLSKEMIESTVEVKQRLRDFSSIGSGAACLLECTDGERAVRGSARAKQKRAVDAIV